MYIITNGEESYIGSTIAGFYKRFLRHYENSGNTHQKTYNLLHNGGEFRILKAMPSSSSEKEVRDMEKYYIDKYLKAGKKLLNSENSSPIVLAAKGKDKRRKQDSLSQDPNVEKEYNKYIKMSKRQNKNKKTVYKKD